VSNIHSLSYYIPELFLVTIILLSIVFDLIPATKKWNYPFTILGLITIGLLLVFGNHEPKSLFNGLIVSDSFSYYFKWIFLIATIAVVLVSKYTKELQDSSLSEYNYLLLVVLFGLFLMASATNLLTIYLGIETVSITSYILAGFMKNNRQSNEASLKYVLFGAFASGMMLYGFSWLYGISGSTNLLDIKEALIYSGNPLLIYSSLLLVLVGIGYKLSMVPFHYWTPDVYEGSPTPITAFLSVAPKAAGFALLIRVFYMTFSNIDYSPILQLQWPTVIAILSAATMTLGNFIAVQQSNVKRMLAYSSIAHAGYILMAMTVMSNVAIQAIMFYMFVYLFMNLAAFFIAIFVSNKLNAHTIDEWNGLGFRSPLMAGIMVLLLVSLTGLPPTAGFVGKVYLFSALIKADSFYWLLVIAILNSVVSLFYYFKIVKSMYFEKTDNISLVKPHPMIQWVIIILSIPVLVLGVYWSPLIEWISNSSQILQ
jgi:NADH-quinone oxidoreductase subunit N